MDQQDLVDYSLDLNKWVENQNPQSRSPGNKFFDSEWNGVTEFNDGRLLPDSSGVVGDFWDFVSANFTQSTFCLKSNFYADSNLNVLDSLPTEETPTDDSPINSNYSPNLDFEQGKLTVPPVTKTPLKLRDAKQKIKFESGKKDWEIPAYLAYLTSSQQDNKKHELVFQGKAFYIPECLKGLTQSFGVKVGIKQLVAIASAFAHSALNSYMAPVDFVPLNYLALSVGKDFSTKFLKGSLVASQSSVPLGLEIFTKPVEELIELAGDVQYVAPSAEKGKTPDFAKTQTVKPKNLAEMVLHLLTPLYVRSGLQNFPFFVPKDLTKEGLDKTGALDSTDYLYIDSASEFSMWIFKQLEAVLGSFPLRISVKDQDKKEKLMELPNLAETLSEILGVLTYQTVTEDMLLKLNVKQSVESIKTFLTALESRDYAKANAEFLGYRITESGVQVPVGFDTTSTSLDQFLSGGKSFTTRYEIDSTQTEDLLSILNHIAVSADIAKAAVTRRVTNSVPGERIKQRVDNAIASYESKWQTFMDVINQQKGVYAQIKNFNPKIKEL